ncbi:MAG: hypothetical protein JW793_08175 [Acidobacteria bacterium]|nr:hypothetical protein [Acidobacteriota bacterium]
MKMPQYISTDEVRKVCRKLKIRDWTKLKETRVLPREAETILGLVNESKMKIDPDDFRAGLEVELEHGCRFRDANVTNNHPVLTGLIVLAHFKESLDYYKLLEVAELEGDLVKAVRAGDAAKIKKYYGKLAAARIVLSRAELKRIGAKQAD